MTNKYKIIVIGKTMSIISRVVAVILEESLFIKVCVNRN